MKGRTAAAHVPFCRGQQLHDALVLSAAHPSTHVEFARGFARAKRKSHLVLKWVHTITHV